jgi:nucleoside-diphosphate-sugar epimerase
VSPPKVLVTGGRGFIGSHVVAALQGRGIQVTNLPQSVDYHDGPAVTEVLHTEKPSVLIHSAWRLAPGSAYLTDPVNRGEIEASLRLFELASAAGCARIVGLGTCLEYQDSPNPVGEDAPLEPRTTYAQSKAELFIAAEAWARESGASFAWARLYFPFGPREAPHRLVPTVISGLLHGDRVATTTGRQRRSFLYATDAGDAIAAIAISGVGGAVNVGAEKAVSVRRVVERLGELIGRPDLLDIGAVPDRPGDPAVLWPRVDKLRSAVKWSPARDLDEGLRETISWWRARL